MRYIKTILTLCSCICLSMVSMAQTSEEATKEINRIKLSTDYLYAETTMADEAEALEGAYAILEMQVRDWLAIQGKSNDANTHIMQAKEHFSTINTMRRTYHRVFVYVQKKDIISLNVGDNTLVVRTDEQAPEPVTELSQSDVEVVVLTPEEEEISKIQQFEDVEPYVKKLQNAGKLQAYGKYKNMPKSTACHLLVYDKQGNIVATMRRVESGEMLNLKTCDEDDIKNYKGCGAIWLQLKK